MTLDEYRLLPREEQVRLGAQTLAVAAAVQGRTVVRSPAARTPSPGAKAMLWADAEIVLAEEVRNASGRIVMRELFIARSGVPHSKTLGSFSSSRRRYVGGKPKKAG